MPAAPGMVVEINTPELNSDRRTLIEMLFVEGNHFCPSCEKSGDCELQALGYRLGMAAVAPLPYLWPKRVGGGAILGHGAAAFCGCVAE